MLIELRGVGKRFGGQTALRDIHLTLEPGEVHALVGENGAGKSTCLGIAGGRVTPSAGEVLVDGAPVAFHRPRDAARHGIVSVYQELSIVPQLTAVQNVFLGQEMRAGLFQEDRRRMREEFLRICGELRLDFDPDAPADRLSVGDQQMLEIMKALASDAKAVFLDEPTASLGPREREKLFSVIDLLVRKRVVVAFVSHNLDEVLQVSDRVTVFRDGALVESRPTGEWSRDSLTTAMIGGTLASVAEPVAPPVGSPGDPDRSVVATEVRGAHVGPVSLSLRPGEIVGIAGLVGSGRSTLLRMLAGDQRAAAGRLRVGETGDQPLPASVRRARRRGVFLLSEDRKGTGLLLEASSAENIVLGNLDAVSRGGLVRGTLVKRRAAAVAERVAFDLRRLETPVVQLSGGNQQKSLLARALLFSPALLLADEPTRGVDIGAKAEIFAALHDLAASGTSVLMVSSEFEELAERCTRVYVMWHGRIVAELSGRELTVDNMVRLSFGPEKEA